VGKKEVKKGRSQRYNTYKWKMGRSERYGIKKLFSWETKSVHKTKCTCYWVTGYTLHNKRKDYMLHVQVSQEPCSKFTYPKPVSLKNHLSSNLLLELQQVLFLPAVTTQNKKTPTFS
jgi:hypothetical protein